MICRDSHVSALVHNPATLAPAVAQLLPVTAVAAELRGDGAPELLMGQEQASIVAARPERQRQFAAGRLCARRALAEYGISEFPLLAAADRCPRWPSHLTGSITHTQGYCAAVVCERAQLMGVGLDAEIVTNVSARLWTSIAAPSELAWLQQLPWPQAQRAAALLFAAKEAFYKAQYGIVGQWLDFHAVAVVPDGAHELIAEGSFRLAPERPLNLATRVGEPWRGRFRFHESYVLAGVALSGT